MSKWYSDEEKQIIEKVKEYLKCIRTPPTFSIYESIDEPKLSFL